MGVLITRALPLEIDDSSQLSYLDSPGGEGLLAAAAFSEVVSRKLTRFNC